MGYENGWIATDDSFEETRKHHYINQYVQGRSETAIEDFSRLIRPHLADR